MVVFVCEDSPEGIFTGVYDAWNSRLGHENVRLEVQGEYNYSLFSEYREVAVDRLKAQKVVRSVRRSLSELAYSWIYRTALSEREDRAEAVYRFLVCGFSAGHPSACRWQGRHPDGKLRRTRQKDEIGRAHV